MVYHKNDLFLFILNDRPNSVILDKLHLLTAIKIIFIIDNYTLFKIYLKIVP